MLGRFDRLTFHNDPSADQIIAMICSPRTV